MSGLDHARDAVNFVASTVDAALGVVEDSIFMKDIIDRCASTHGVDFTKHVVQIAKQQRRYCVSMTLLRFASIAACAGATP